MYTGFFTHKTLAIPPGSHFSSSPFLVVVDSPYSLHPRPGDRLHRHLILCAKRHGA